MSTTLQKAIAGEKVPDSKKTGVLNEALDKVKSMGGRIAKARELSETVADAVVATAETQGAVFAASFAEGYFGEEKMDVGPIDMRVGGGLVFGGYGLYKLMSGKGGAHALAIGNGLLATGIGRIGRHAGKALAEKKAAPQTPPPAAAPPPSVPAAAPVPQLKGDDIGDIVRMVRMTPGTEGELAGRRGGGRHPRRPGRFLRARDEQDDE